MDKEEKHFLTVLTEFNQELAGLGLSQDLIRQDDKQGVIVKFERKNQEITINYNLPEFDQNTKEYLLDQREKHKKFLKALQDHRLERKTNLHRLRDLGHTSLPASGSGIEQDVYTLSIDLAFDRLYKEAAKIGKYFFEARKDEGVSIELKSILENLIGSTHSIYTNARELEFTDREWLEYLEQKTGMRRIVPER